MSHFKSNLNTEQREELAYQLMTIKSDALELKYGERVHSETIYEGRINFIYEVFFCDDNDKRTTKKIKVTTKGF